MQTIEYCLPVQVLSTGDLELKPPASLSQLASKQNLKEPTMSAILSGSWLSFWCRQSKPYLIVWPRTALALKAADNDLSEERDLSHEHACCSLAATLHAQRVLDLAEPFILSLDYTANRGQHDLSAGALSALMIITFIHCIAQAAHAAITWGNDDVCLLVGILFLAHSQALDLLFKCL
jgi:hypothetical protein